MKKVKKFLALTLVTLTVAAAVSPGALAASPETKAPKDDSISTYAEQLEWHYRYNTTLGRYEKRLWSITYQRWVNDWMPV